MEKAFFFENEGIKLFGNLHIPEDQMTDSGGQGRYGMVFCPPFGDEHIASYRVLRNFAIELCGKGVCVMRFDYRGYGDSEGEFEESTPETQVSDIKRAIEVLKTVTGVQDVGLLGLRLGGTLALLAARSEPDIRFVLVWAPILSSTEYFQRILRQQIFSELANSGMRKTIEEFTSELKKRGKVDIGGYYLSGEVYNYLCNIEFIELLRQVRQPVHIAMLLQDTPNSSDIALDQLRSVGDKHKNIILIPEEPFWDFPIFRTISYPVRLAQETVAWLSAMIHSEVLLENKNQ